MYILRNVEKKLGIGRGKGNNIVEFDANPEIVNRVGVIFPRPFKSRWAFVDSFPGFSYIGSSTLLREIA